MLTRAETRQLRTSNRLLVAALLALVPLGIVARLALSAISWGSNDAMTWFEFGRNISERGLLRMYSTDGEYNHPPIPGLWAAGCYRISQWARRDRPTARPDAPGRVAWFPFVFKLPSIAADAVSCWLLWRVWRDRMSGSALVAAAAAAMFAWNPVAILISAHHCNTDSVYTMLCLAAVYVIDARRAFVWGGVLLGAAINVKLIPVLLIPPMAILCRDARSLVRFAGGLALAAIPFLPILLLEPHGFYHHVLAYDSLLTDWGIGQLLLATNRVPQYSVVTGPLIESYSRIGRWVIVVLILLLSLRAARVRDSAEQLPYRLAATTAALFLALTPGFGVQYVVLPALLLLAVSLPTGALFGGLSGLMLVFCYARPWDGTLPIRSLGGGSQQDPGALWGLLSWATLVAYAARQFHEFGDLTAQPEARRTT